MTPNLVLIPNPNAVPKSECVSTLITQSFDTLLDLRTCFFNHADLVTPGDELVSCLIQNSKWRTSSFSIWQSLLLNYEGVKLPQGRSEISEKRSLHCTKNFSRAVSICHIYIAIPLSTYHQWNRSLIYYQFSNPQCHKIGLFLEGEDTIRLSVHGPISSASPRWHYIRIWKNNAKVQAPLHTPKNHLYQNGLTLSTL